jgi:4,5-dihydroxyphthalate decarboxylase
MSKRIPLTLACADYEIVRALKEGTVQPEGVELTVLTDMDPTTRHRRCLRNREFDVAETSSSGHFVACDRNLPFQAIPVFLHRRFRHGFIFVNDAKGLERPIDLIGKKIGVRQFLASALVWIRGILEDEYGVPYRSCEWYSEIDDSVDFNHPPGLKLTRLPSGRSIEVMLADGEIDAIMHPEVIKPIAEGDSRVRRLFRDYKAEEMNYFRKTGIFPIMHVMGMRRDIVDRHPWVPRNLYRAFERSKAVAMKRMMNPRIVPLAWYQEAWNEQAAVLGNDPWEFGLTERNCKQLKWIVASSHGQGLISRNIPLDELFLPVD